MEGSGSVPVSNGSGMRIREAQKHTDPADPGAEKTGEKTTFFQGFRIRVRIHRIHVFLGLPDPDPLVRGMDPDPVPDPDPSIIKQK